ncbi:MAG: polysaccharide deacetylase family protein, partial [Clostridia bacterium]|nr:polysaccharide deacetylase family protein [Clostridia bacterium]
MKKYRRVTSAVTNIIIIIMLISLTVVSFSGQYSSFVSSNANDRPYYKGNPTRNEVALMINVYWGTEYLDDMLKVLDNHNAKCTFFVGGSWASKNSEYLEKMISKGHEIGNHGYFHKDHAKLNYAQNESEIKSNNVLVSGLTGYKMTLFAPPSGSFSDITLKVAADLGMQ